MNELTYQLLALAGGMIGAYVAIRADLARLEAVVKIAKEDSDKAHDRLDKHISEHA